MTEPYATPLVRGQAERTILLARRVVWPVAATTAVVLIAAENGGYYATTWNWATIVIAWVAATVLLVRERVTVGRLELLTIGALFAFAGWTAVSTLWTVSLPATILEVQRDVVYPVGVLAAAAVFDRRSARRLLGAILTAITLVAWYALATRVFPDRVASFDAFGGYRLFRPIGYWNGLGLFAAMGMLLALGFADRARHPGTRLLAAASFVVLAPTAYFTYSRGAWVALAIGLTAAIALDHRRLRLITTALVVAPAPIVGVLYASRQRGLTRLDSSLGQATHDGHRLALLLVALAFAAGALSLAQGRIEALVVVPRRVRTGYVAALILMLVGGMFFVAGRYGSPETLARKGWTQFTTVAPSGGGENLNARLFSASGSGRTIMWRIAWRAARAHPVAGTGGGTYEIWYLNHRTTAFKVRDAHSLYLEVLAETGPIGLATLLVALLAPLVAAIRARGRSMTPVAAGAYIAFLVHAGVDWDWELSAVTLAGLLCGAAVLIAGRNDKDGVGLDWFRYVLAGLSAVTAILAIVALLGNIPAARAGQAVRATDWVKARSEARKAIRWAPWSADGWRRLGQAELGLQHPGAARRDLETAIRKDPQNWDRWFDLALATSGAEQRRAIEHSLALNPHSPEIAEFISGIGLKGIRIPPAGGGG